MASLNQCQVEKSRLERSLVHLEAFRSCLTWDSEPCSVCEEDIELEHMIQHSELQDKNGIQSLRTRMNTSHDPFILKFPPEIASYILFHSLEDHEPHLYRLPMSFRLATVCQGWRHLARSTPELWSTISFTLTKPEKMGALSQLQAIGDWLQLSGSLPLNIRVFDYIGSNPVSEHGCEPVINILNQCSGRWHRMSLRLPVSYSVRFCGTSSPSMLWDLRFFESSNLNRPGVLPPFRMASMPSLTHLAISSFPVKAFEIVWNNLTFLKLFNIPLDRCVEVLRQTPVLEFCFLDLINFKYTDVPTIPKTIVKLMYLRKLHLYWFSADLLIRFVDMMVLPSLEEYHYESTGAEMAVDAVILLLNRSGSRLKRLIMWLHGQPTVKDLKKLLNAVPYLRNLKLDIYHASDAFALYYLLQKLSSSPPTLCESIPGFLPHLQSLEISSDARVTPWWCIPRIYSWPHRKSLRLEINTIVKPRIGAKILEKIFQLVDQGVDMSILDYGEDYLQKSKQEPTVPDSFSTLLCNMAETLFWDLLGDP